MRVLLLTSRCPTPPHTGDRLRATLWIEALRDHELVVAGPPGPGVDLPVPRSIGTLSRALLDTHRRRLPFHALLAARGWEAALAGAGRFDTAIVLLSRTAPWLGELPARRKILDAIDAAAANMRERAVASRGLGRRFWRLEERRSERFERTLAARYDAVLTVAREECLGFGDKGVLLPMGVQVPEPTAMPRSVDFGFWGRLGYFANEQAVRTLVHEVWPAIRHLHPAATIFIGGADAPAWMRSLDGREGIRFESPMLSRADALARVKVALFPLALGSGQSLKTLEAAAAGCAIAGTPTALRGCEQLADLAVVEADPRRLAARALALLLDEAVRERAGRELRERVLRHYSHAAVLEQMRAVV